MVTAALAGDLDNVEYGVDPVFRVNVPKTCPGVPDEVLDPVNLWGDRDKYMESAKKLAALFEKNFKSKFPDMPENIASAGPKA